MARAAAFDFAAPALLLPPPAIDEAGVALAARELAFEVALDVVIDVPLLPALTVSKCLFCESVSFASSAYYGDTVKRELSP